MYNSVSVHGGGQTRPTEDNLIKINVDIKLANMIMVSTGKVGRAASVYGFIETLQLVQILTKMTHKDTTLQSTLLHITNISFNVNIVCTDSSDKM